MFGLFRIYVIRIAAYTLSLIASVEGGSGLSFPSMNSDVPRYGLYRIHGKIPKGFEGVYEFELAPLSGNTPEASEAKGQSAIGGALFVHPSEFQEKVQTESRGELSVDGAFSEFKVVRLKFKSATLVREPATSTQLEFETESVQEVHYLFKGTFSDGFLLPGGPYISLRGTLTKFTKGKRTAESELNFVRSSYE